MSIPSMSDIDLSGKRVLIRQDLNVPVKDGKVTSDARIKASIPTIKAALNAGAAVMVMSHLGRPTEGQYDEAFSITKFIRLGQATMFWPFFPRFYYIFPLIYLFGCKANLLLLVSKWKSKRNVVSG